jgi:tetratricopeptide (TPR) repeat protein
MKGRKTHASLLQRAAQLRQAGRVNEAIAAYEEALRLDPAAPDSWYNLGWLQRRAGRFEAALASYGEALARGVRDPEEVHLNRGVILADHLARPAEAEAELRSALALHPTYRPALLNLGNLHEDRGDRAAARAAYEQVLAIHPGDSLALARLAGLADPAQGSEILIERLRAALASPSSTPVERTDLGFALGRLLDASGAYDEAFAAYADANRAGREAAGPAFAGYDRAAAEALVDRLIAAFPAPRPADGSRSGEAPIFICGMFRSGSTLAEQILAGHSEVTPGGELDLLPALVRERIRPYPEALAGADERTIGDLRAAYLEGLRAVHPALARVTDKRPDNFLHIGLIMAMFPDAKIVHTAREPLDNCLSVWFLQLDPGMTYSFDLADIGHWYRQYRRLMDHWKALFPGAILDLDYDLLVAEPRREIAALLDFCGLPWEESCLDFHRATNAVRTASVWQVREPLYRRASGRWRNYARHLDRLRAALAGQ